MKLFHKGTDRPERMVHGLSQRVGEGNAILVHGTEGNGVSLDGTPRRGPGALKKLLAAGLSLALGAGLFMACPDGDSGGDDNGGGGGGKEFAGTLIITDTWKGTTALTEAKTGQTLYAVYTPASGESFSGYLNYQWNKDGEAIATGYSHTPSEPGSYTVTLKNDYDGYNPKTSAAVTVAQALPSSLNWFFINGTNNGTNVASAGFTVLTGRELTAKFSVGHFSSWSDGLPEGASVSFQWKKDGAAVGSPSVVTTGTEETIYSSACTSFTASAYTPDAAGEYTCAAKVTADGVTYAPVSSKTITVITEPATAEVTVAVNAMKRQWSWGSGYDCTSLVQVTFTLPEGPEWSVTSEDTAAVKTWVTLENSRINPSPSGWGDVSVGVERNTLTLSFKYQELNAAAVYSTCTGAVTATLAADKLDEMKAKTNLTTATLTAGEPASDSNWNWED